MGTCAPPDGTRKHTIGFLSGTGVTTGDTTGVVTAGVCLLLLSLALLDLQSFEMWPTLPQ